MSDSLLSVSDQVVEHGQALGPARDDFLPLPQVFSDQIRPERGNDELTVGHGFSSVRTYSPL